jgi:predicted branched-subunit amino acid permease
VGLFAAGAAGITVVLTTLLLNVRHVLYGLTLGGRMSLTPRQRPVGAYFLTDETFGVVVAQPDRSFAYLLGAELSLFATWNLSTLAGAVLGGAIPDPERLGVDFVFPLAFLALLGPLLRGRNELVVAAASGALAFGASKVLPAGLPILVTGIAGSLLGAWLARGTEAEPERDLRDLAREVA